MHSLLVPRPSRASSASSNASTRALWGLGAPASNYGDDPAERRMLAYYRDCRRTGSLMTNATLQRKLDESGYRERLSRGRVQKGRGLTAARSERTQWVKGRAEITRQKNEEAGEGSRHASWEERGAQSGAGSEDDGGSAFAEIWRDECEAREGVRVRESAISRSPLGCHL